MLRFVKGIEMPHRQAFAAAVMISSCAFPQPASAVNNAFLPGDAFFPTTLTLEQLESLLEAPPRDRVYSYRSYGGYSGAFCGHAGYFMARVAKADDEILKKLLVVTKEIRTYEPRQLIEETRDGKTRLRTTNPIRVQFYAASAHGAVTGIRYNEGWKDEVLSFGHKRARLCCLIADHRAVEQSWRDGSKFAALPAALPPDEKTPRGVDTPITITGPVQARVSASTPAELFRRSEDDWLVEYRVTRNGIQEIRYDTGGEKRAEWRLIDGQWKPPSEKVWDNDDEPF